MGSRIAIKDHQQRALVLSAIALASIAAWQTQIGSLVLYPFTILATWFHEMGHGIAAMLTGGSFEHLVIYPDGSGYAQSLIPADSVRLTNAFIAACGPLGPASAGSMLIVSSRKTKSTRFALGLLGAVLLISTVIWVRSAIGWIVLPGLGLVILAVALRAPPRVQQFVIQLLGVQACISVWRQFGYLFSTGGVGPSSMSDTAAIANALFLPYWVWGMLISAMTVAILWWSFHVAFRR